MAGELVAVETRIKGVPLAMQTQKRFTPALGYEKLTPLYDLAIAGLTREQTWRKRLIDVVSPQAGERILDVGCGTGSLIKRIKKVSPQTHLMGVDPDEAVLERAKRKAGKHSHEIEWHVGFLTSELADVVKPIDKVISSLVLHQTPIAEKKRILETMRAVLKPGGSVHIADYGLQRTRLMRTLFRRTVQAIDGVEDTTPNAEGRLPEYMKEAGFADVTELQVVPTVTGSISIYMGTAAH